MITAHSRVKHKRRQRHRVHHSNPRRRFFLLQKSLCLPQKKSTNHV